MQQCNLSLLLHVSSNLMQQVDETSLLPDNPCPESLLLFLWEEALHMIPFL